VDLIHPPHATCSRYLKIQTDTTDLPTEPGSYSIIVIPGGAKGAATLSQSPGVQSLLRKFEEQDKIIGTICAGSLAIKSAGLIIGGKVTSHPSVENEFEGYKYSRERVVIEHQIVSSRGPGTALEWSLTMVELVSGKGKRDEVAAGMVLHPSIS